MLASLIFFVIAVLSFVQIAHVMKGDINDSSILLSSLRSRAARQVLG